MNVRVRPASADDAAAVADLESELFGVDAWSPDAVAEELVGPRRTSLVACAAPAGSAAGPVVGYAVVSVSHDVADLLRIGVSRTHRRTGVGRVLLAEATSAARSAGAHRMLLEVSAGNPAALAFYAAEGFVEIDRRPRYYRDGTDALVLRLPLGVAACGGGRKELG